MKETLKDRIQKKSKSDPQKRRFYVSIYFKAHHKTIASSTFQIMETQSKTQSKKNLIFMFQLALVSIVIGYQKRNISVFDIC